MDKFRSVCSLLCLMIAGYSHFLKPHNHEHCEFWLLGGILLALLAIALKDKD